MRIDFPAFSFAGCLARGIDPLLSIFMSPLSNPICRQLLISPDIIAAVSSHKRVAFDAKKSLQRARATDVHHHHSSYFR